MEGGRTSETETERSLFWEGGGGRSGSGRAQCLFGSMRISFIPVYSSVQKNNCQFWYIRKMLRGFVRYQIFLVNDKTNTTTKVESRRSRRESDSSESNGKYNCVCPASMPSIYFMGVVLPVSSLTYFSLPC